MNKEVRKMLPKIISGTKKIAIICEGDEEFDYLQSLLNLHVWNENYDVRLINALGNGNIPARYQDIFQNGMYDMIFVFCDTDRKPYEQYEDIKDKIDTFLGIDNAHKYIVIYGNPCTMQIIILHFDNIILASHRKNKNAPTIEKYTGIKQYNAKKSKRAILFSLINKENYTSMLERVSKLPNDDQIIGSSNFDILMNYLSDEDDSWINRINQYLGL